MTECRVAFCSHARPRTECELQVETATFSEQRHYLQCTLTRSSAGIHVSISEETEPAFGIPTRLLCHVLIRKHYKEDVIFDLISIQCPSAGRNELRRSITKSVSRSKLVSMWMMRRRPSAPLRPTMLRTSAKFVATWPHTSS